MASNGLAAIGPRLVLGKQIIAFHKGLVAIMAHVLFLVLGQVNGIISIDQDYLVIA